VIWIWFLVLGATAGGSSPVVLAWPASPTRDADGLALPPAVSYLVFATSDGGPPECLAEVVDDTTGTVRLRHGVVTRFRVVGIDAAGRTSVPSAWSDPFVVQSPETAPARALGNAPNPFNPSTRITYTIPPDLPPGAPVRLEIYGLRGDAIRRLPVEAAAGDHTVAWDGTNDRDERQPSGAYLVRFTCGATTATLTMVLTR
jgi:hypothetical protein